MNYAVAGWLEVGGGRGYYIVFVRHWLLLQTQNHFRIVIGAAGGITGKFWGLYELSTSLWRIQGMEISTSELSQNFKSFNFLFCLRLPQATNQNSINPLQLLPKGSQSSYKKTINSHGRAGMASFVLVSYLRVNTKAYSCPHFLPSPFPLSRSFQLSLLYISN